ncbi:lysostaphin resistance A-like protein [Halorubrum sp. DTA46]|uniref:CPBP family intramembrane glutamic endopeptidase n=1 Tax=Halorubrum sp. DTA46 TaxID=3402162 RepID=UPI003AAA7B29
MPDWVTFAAATVALTLLLLFLTRRSQQLLEQARIVDRGHDTSDPIAGDETGAVADRESDRDNRGGGGIDGTNGTDDTDDTVVAVEHAPTATEGTEESEAPFAEGAAEPGFPSPERPVLTTEALLANAALSQLFALSVLVAIAWWTGVPAAAFGLGAGDPLPVSAAVALGAAAGSVLYAGNEVAAALGARVGVSTSERLREAMAPDDARGWGVLLGVVLPIVAVFEEALFRGALIGAVAMGFAVDPWLLAVASSVAFGLGHGAQGRLGVVVTGALGFALAAIYVSTGSLLVVIVAHYVVNVAEFVVREGFGFDPLGAGA